MDEQKQVKFDARSIFRFPFLSLPAKSCARILMAGIWGLMLSDSEVMDLNVRIAVGAVLGGMLLVLSPSFFGWDRSPMDASRTALYGLYMAGEMLGIGTIVMGFAATFCGRMEPYAMVLCGLGGSLFTLYPMAQLVARNISENRGSSRLE